MHPINAAVGRSWSVLCLCVLSTDIPASVAKTAGPIEMPLTVDSRGPRNHVLNWSARLCNTAITIKRSMHGGGADLRQITLATCFTCQVVWFTRRAV